MDDEVERLQLLESMARTFHEGCARRYDSNRTRWNAKQKITSERNWRHAQERLRKAREPK